MKDKNFIDIISKSTIEIAKNLLGMKLVLEKGGESEILGNIVETEAYLGTRDSACHSFMGKRTRVMNPCTSLPGTGMYIKFMVILC